MSKAIEEMSLEIQGSQDRLCGVYSVVNAMKALDSRLSDKSKTNDLFQTLIKSLEERGKLADTTSEGMGFRDLGAVLDDAARFMQSEFSSHLVRKVANKSETEGLSIFWKQMSNWISENGTGSVILGLSGKHDHWTCIKSISDRQISLLDSDGISRLNKIYCTVREANNVRKHVLWSTQTYFLNYEKQK